MRHFGMVLILLGKAEVERREPSVSGQSKMTCLRQVESIRSRWIVCDFYASLCP
jgi:hypothetical protein